MERVRSHGVGDGNEWVEVSVQLQMGDVMAAPVLVGSLGEEMSVVVGDLILKLVVERKK